MSESTPKPPYRIPIEEDYEAAAEMTDDLLQSRGGPWLYYHKTSLLEIHTKQTTQDLLSVMSSHARLVEPIQDNHLTPRDARYMATHAFRAGMWTAGFMSEQLHKGVISFTMVSHLIGQSLPHTPITTQAEHEVNGRYLMTIGDEGLKRVGYATREYINRWGEDIVSEENVRRYYALGAGAILYTSHMLYTNVYNDMRISYEASLLTNEVSQFLANPRDSSDN